MIRTGTTLGFRSILAVAMIAQASFCLMQRGSAVVTAFSLATTLSSKSVGATAAASRSTGYYGVRPAFYKASTRTMSSMKLQMGSAVLEKTDLENKLEVVHPAYEILQKDFIEEYGAAATLYRHKKSGAELLSVSTDDDNKVFGITFRTPRKLILESS
jgi:hypothetical protein